MEMNAPPIRRWLVEAAQRIDSRPGLSVTLDAKRLSAGISTVGTTWVK